MDEDAYRVRPFQASDYDAIVRLESQVDPTRPTSREEIEYFERVFFTPPNVLHRIVVEARPTGQAIGVGWLHSDPEGFDPATFWVNAAVDTNHQGRGVGRALADELFAEARRRGAIKLWAAVFGDTSRAVRFFQHRGFVQRRRVWKSRLDIEALIRLPDRSATLGKEGITFLTAVDLNLSEQSVVRELYELNAAVSADEPRLGAHTTVTLEQFVGSELRGPTFLPGAYFLARADGRFVALSSLRRIPAEPSSLLQSFTGTLREYRGRGIATELKRRGVEFAAKHGQRTVYAYNDNLNPSILAINRKLGFRAERERIIGEWRRGD